MNLGKKITTLRKESKITQEHLAELIGVTRQTISNWELNITKPDINQIKEISKIFNISIDELLDNEINNIIYEKINKTEKLVNKNNQKLRTIITIIYFIILSLIILLTIYFLTRKDFTKKYQMEFNCSNKEQNFNISVADDESENTSYSIVIMAYNEDLKQNEIVEKIYAGSSIQEVTSSMQITKEMLIENYHTICR